MDERILVAPFSAHALMNARSAMEECGASCGMPEPQPVKWRSNIFG